MYSSTQYTPSPRSTRHRSQNYTWDHTYFYSSETTLTPASSVIATYHSTPSPTPSPPPPTKPLTALPSRVNALNRRAAIVSANLAHLTAVVKPLETTQLDALSDDLLNDMWEEGQGLRKAMEAFKEQMAEVSGLLEDLLESRRKRSRKVVGVGRGRGKGKGGESEY